MLFTDLVESSARLAQLGDEAFGEAIAAHLDLLYACVERQSGEPVKNVGDGIMAVFDRPAAAAACAVQVQQAVTLFGKREGEVPFLVRVGISCGEPVESDNDYFGTSVVEAARLCNAAEAGQILVSPSLRAQLDDSAWAMRPIGAVELKGLPAPLDVTELGWEPTTDPAVIPEMGDTAIRALPPSVHTRSVFVGRDGYRTQLLDSWHACVAEGSRVVLLGGDAGVGKTALAATVATAIHDEGGFVLLGACPSDVRMDYQPVAEALGRVVESAPVSMLRRHVGANGGELARVLPALSRRMPRLQPPLEHDEPDAQRYRLFEAITAFLANLAATAPVLLVIDDLHWATKPTLGLIGHLARNLGDARVLVVGSFRDNEVDATLADLLADLRRFGSAQRIKLEGLGPDEIAGLIDAEAPGALAMADRLTLAQAIHRDTQGNAFFAREIVRHLAETGGLVGTAGRTHLGLPDSVLEIVARRVSRLPADAQEVLTAASVVGSTFTLPLIQELTGLGEDDALDAVDLALDAELVVEEGADAFTFAHSLIRTALYQSLRASRRKRLHSRTAAALEAAGAHLDDGVLAYHLAEAASGEEVARAVRLCYQAGVWALDRRAYEEAAEHLSRALALVDGGAAIEDEARRLLALAGAEALNRVGRVAEARQRYDEAAALARSAGDADQLAAAATGFSTVIEAGDLSGVQQALDLLDEAAAMDDLRVRRRAAVLSQSARWVRMLGRHDQAAERAALALTLAEAEGEPALVMEVLGNEYWALFGPEHTHARLQVATRLLQMALGASSVELILQAHEWRLRDLLELGLIPAAAAEADAMCALAERVRHPQYLWYGAAYRAMRATVEGRFADAERLIHEARASGRDLRSRHPARRREARVAVPADAVAELQTYMLRWGQGRLRELRPSMEALVRQAPHDDGWSSALALAYTEESLSGNAAATLEALAGRGFHALSRTVEYLSKLAALSAAASFTDDAEAAEELHEILLPYADRDCTNLEFAYFGSVSHWLGVLATTLGRIEEAEERFETALVRHRDLGSPVWSAFTEHAWARALRGVPGRTQQVDDLAASALAKAQQLGMRGLEKRLAEL